MDHTTISLKPTGDYGFGLTLGYLRTSPSAILEHLTDTGFSRALDIGQGVVISVERDGLLPSDDPLLLTIWSEKLSPDLIDITVRHVRRMLTLDVDGSMIERLLLQRDSVTGRYATSYHGFRPILLGTPWEAFLWAVCGQLIDAQQAKVIRTRLVKLGDRRLMVGDREYALPPSPDWIARQDCGAVRSVGLSRAKAEAILQAARAIVAGTIPWSVYPRLPHSDTLTRLEAMPGVGPWTTAIVGLRGFGDLDALPVGDAAIQMIVGRHSRPDGARLSTGALAAYGQSWAPYRGWATYVWWLQIQAEEAVRRAVAPVKEDATNVTP